MSNRRIVISCAIVLLSAFVAVAIRNIFGIEDNIILQELPTIVTFVVAILLIIAGQKRI